MTNIKNFKATNRFILGAGLIIATVFAVSIPVVFADTLNRQLEVGMSGSDVSSLQTFLAQDRTLYPQGLVTGYFGLLTKAAVSNFQVRNDIPSVGRVGPITLSVLNMQMVNGVSNSVGAAPIFTGLSLSVNSNSANIGWSTNENAKSVVYYSTSPLSMSETLANVTVFGASSSMIDSNFRTSQNLVLQNLQSNTTYYYTIYVTDQNGNVSLTWPSTFHTAN